MGSCKAAAKLGSRFLGSHLLEFVATSDTEFAQWIGRSDPRHIAQLNEALVRLQISITDFLDDLLRAIPHRL
jgi:hypothetical protein